MGIRVDGVEITLVHGTASCGAAWTRSGSAMRAALQEIEGVESIHGVTWTGRNSHRARLEGGKRLAQSLRDRIERSPGRRHIIVAHSHGGNVALYGLHRLPRIDRVMGVICLATPFIHARRWGAGRMAGRVLLGLPSAVAGAVSGWLLFEGLRRLSLNAGGHEGAMPLWMLGIGVSLGAALFAAVTLVLYRSWSAWSRRRAVTFRRSLRVRGLSDLPIVAIRYSGDEASVWLRVGRALTDVPVRIWNTGIGWVCSFIAVVAVLVWLRGSAQTWSPDGKGVTEVIRGVLLAGGSGGVPLILWVVGVALVWVVLAWLVRRVATGGLFGFLPWGASLGVSVRVLDRPQGRWRHFRFHKLRPPTRRPAFRRRDMSHCRIYSQPEVLRIVADTARGMASGARG